MLEEGWYLMSVGALERELIRWRTGSGAPGEHVQRLTTEEALAYRDAGNVPDELGRSLRLVLHVFTESDLSSLEAKRRSFEPDYLGAPEWRRAGSVPVNVVPLRDPSVKGSTQPWWEERDLAELESEWGRTGGVAGLQIPGEYRSFVFKALLALRADGRAVTPDTVGDALARWLTHDQTQEIRRALRRANP